MVKIYISYKLRDGVTRAQFREWSSTIDQPTMLAQPGVLSYRTYDILEQDGGEPWCDVIEEYEAESVAEWRRILQTPPVQEMVKQFRELGDPDTSLMFYGSVIDLKT